MSLHKNLQEEMFSATSELQDFLPEDDPKGRQGRIGVTLHGSSNSEEEWHEVRSF